jgi:hypothetical protein
MIIRFCGGYNVTFAYRVKLRHVLALVQPLKCILVAVCRVNVTWDEEVPIFREDLHYNAYQDT